MGVEEGRCQPTKAEAWMEAWMPELQGCETALVGESGTRVTRDTLFSVMVRKRQLPAADRSGRRIGNEAQPSYSVVKVSSQLH